MSTRGIYGFHINGTDKLAYNHADSYPHGLGANILSELHQVADWGLARKLIADLIPIHETRELDANSEIFQAELRRHYDELNWRSTPTNYYDLLSPIQGKLEPFLSGRLSFIATANEFIDDSLFCEWGYIANLDSNEFEVYRGSQTTEPPEPTRYTGEPTLQGYYPCRRIESYPLEQLPKREEFLEDTQRWR